MLSTDDFLSATCEGNSCHLSPSACFFHVQMEKEWAEAGSIDLGLSTQVSHWFHVNAAPVPLAELLLVSISTRKRRSRDCHRRTVQRHTGGVQYPYFHPAEKLCLWPPHSLTWVELTLIYTGEGQGRIEHNKLNLRIGKGHWRGRQSARRKS